MTTFRFTPSSNGIADIPDFEDARQDFAPYYASEKKIDQAKNEVMVELAKLGANGFLQDGYFSVNGRKRYGYQLMFYLGGTPGVMRIAGLPIRTENPRKIERVRVQALLNLRDWLKASVTAQVFNPGANVLVQYLLVDDHRTVMDYLTDTGRLPLLNPPPEMDVMESEIMEGESA